jgi:hypothetical protein
VSQAGWKLARRRDLPPSSELPGFSPPGVSEAVALETPTLLLILGGRPGELFSPPLWGVRLA